MAWQLIETAPKDGTPVLVAFVETGDRKRRRKPYVGEAEYRPEIYGGGAWWWPNENAIDPPPTHWMPLPDPPT